MKINFFGSLSTKHLLLFIVWPLVASCISFLFHFNIFYSTLVFLAIPSIFLSFLLPKMVKKVLFFSIFSTIPFSIIIDYLAHFNKQWLVLNNTFPKFLGYVAIEDVIWVVFFVYFVVMFYEYFVDFSKKTIIWNPRMKQLVGCSWGGSRYIFYILFFISFRT